MPSVRVERLPVETLSLGRFGFDHVQIVFRSDFGSENSRQDTWFVIEGLRAAEGSDVRLVVEGWHGGTTLSEANGGLTGEALVARIGNPEERSPREIAEGSGAIKLWAELVAYAADIEKQKFPYIAMSLPGSPLPTVNSTSLISSLLYHAGLDVRQAMPSGLRFSPGKGTLLGTSGDDTLATGKGFNTVLGGAGNDRLSGRNDLADVDKLYGGRGDDIIQWSQGFAIIHGGEPGLAYEQDGFDTVDYSGAGDVRLEAPRPGPPHVTPDFIATYAGGMDHLFSIEQIVWDGRSDRLLIGPGVGLRSPHLEIDFGGEEAWGRGDVIDLSEAEFGFGIVAGSEQTLHLTARVGWSGSDAHGLTVRGAEWVIGSAHGDRFVLGPGLRGVEGGDGDDLFDLRDARQLFVSSGGGDDTLIVGAGNYVVQGGTGTNRYVIAHPSASLIIERALPQDRLVVGWAPASVRTAYDGLCPDDLVIRMFLDEGDQTGTTIRVRGHRPGDLSLDAARDIVWVNGADGLEMISGAALGLADGVVAENVTLTNSSQSSKRTMEYVGLDDPSGATGCGLDAFTLAGPLGLFGG